MNFDELKQKTKSTLDFIFPDGNYRYYIWYFLFPVVTMIMVMCMTVVFNQIVLGQTIHIEGFYAIVTSGIPDYPQSIAHIVTLLLNSVGFLCLVMYIHTSLSLLIDISRYISRLQKRFRNWWIEKRKWQDHTHD